MSEAWLPKLGGLELESISVKPLITWYGGKIRLAKKIVSIFPDHKIYCEPYAGGLSVLLSKPYEGISEYANDLNGRITNFWRVIQDEALFAAFQRRIDATPFSEAEWQWSRAIEPVDPITRAVAFFINCRQSFGGSQRSFSPPTRLISRGMGKHASSWLSAVDRLPDVHDRLKRVQILNRSAISVIEQLDSADTQFYLDPPYLGETRTARNVYEYEMDREQHEVLLDTIRQCKGKVVISGYPSELYDSRLRDWHLTTLNVPNNASGGKTKRRMTECLWRNFA